MGWFVESRPPLIGGGVVEFRPIPQFPFRGGRGGLTKNDHEFPFLRIVELFERSLILWYDYNVFQGHISSTHVHLHPRNYTCIVHLANLSLLIRTLLLP